MKIAVDWELCESNGVCAFEAPGYFELDDDDELHVLREDVAPGDEDSVTRAVAGCPRGALTAER